MEHTLVAKVVEDTIFGKVDFMVVRGGQISEVPYFCLHEYKPEEGTSNDSYGQLLIAMMAANQVTKLNIPVYGMHNLDRIFYFFALNEKEFMRSKPYATAEQDVFEVSLILKKTRGFIEELKI